MNSGLYDIDLIKPGNKLYYVLVIVQLLYLGEEKLSPNDEIKREYILS